MAGIVIWFVVGALVGFIASAFMKPDARHGPMTNVVIGVVGAALGGFLLRLLGASSARLDDDGLDVYSAAAAAAGAAALLAVVRRRRGRATWAHG